MQIQVFSDHNIHGHQSMKEYIEGAVEAAIGRFEDHITHVEVHVSDENGEKGGDKDIRCMVEARLKHQHPVAVTEHAAHLEQAVEGAADKMASLLGKTLDRLKDLARHRSDPLPPSAVMET